MQGVRASKAELIERFGLSNLLAVRVGALLGLRVDLTEAVLELASQESQVAALLRHPQLLKQAPQLDTTALQQLAAQTQADQHGNFVVVASDDWRTIALEEEVLAEQAWAAPQNDADPATAPLARLPASSALQPTDLSDFFTPEQIAKLKLSALTSADSGAKIEAMRKLMFAPISDQEKGAVLLKILIDPISNVRAEAVNGLRSIGFSQGLAEAVTALLEGDEGTKVFAADRISRLLTDASDQETFIVAEVLLEALREAQSAAEAESLVRALGTAGQFLVRSETHFQQFVESCMLRLASGQRSLSATARSALLDIGRNAPDAVADLLWRQLATTDAPTVRVFLLTTISQLPVTGDRVSAFAEAIVDEMLKLDVGEDERLRLRYGAVRLSAASLGPLLSRLPSAAADRQCIIIGVLDAIATERPISQADKTRVARCFLDTLKIASRQVAINILQSRICAAPDIDPEVRTELAREFLANLREFHMPDVRDRITDTLTRIGPQAVAPILDFVEDAPNDAESVLPLRVLGDIAETYGSQCPRADIDRATEFCLRCWADDSIRFGAFIYALSNICAAGMAPPELTSRLAGECRDRLWHAPYTFDLLEALGVLGGSPNCDLDHKVAITHLFTDLIQRQPPDEVGSEVATDDGILYVFGKETDFDTIVLPIVVRGLERICVSANSSRSLREHIIMCMLNAWGDITNYRIIWGPLAVEAITRAIGRIGAHQTTPLTYCVHIARVLSRQVSRFVVVKSLGELFQQAGPSDELDALAIESAEAMIDEWTQPDVTDDERIAFLLSLAQTLTREHLDPDQEQVRTLRRRAVDLLFDALKDGLFEVRQALELMKGCPTLPKRMRDEITDRLNKTYGLIKRQAGPKQR